MIERKQNVTQGLCDEAHYLASTAGKVGEGCALTETAFWIAYVCMHLREQAEASRELAKAIEAMGPTREGDPHGQ